MNARLLAAGSLLLGCTATTTPHSEMTPPAADASSSTSEAPRAPSTSTDSSSSDTSTSGDGSSSDSSSTGSARCRGLHPGAQVVVDGSLERDEWADATPFVMTPGRGWEVPVGIKHDGESLLFAFAALQPATSPPVAFPEVMLDVNNDKATRLASDDWWFHVSATDCSAIGRLDDYKTCVPEADGWAANNFPAGTLIDIVEIAIEFETLGIDPTQEQDVGLLLRLSDTQGFAAHWPAAADPQDPSSWSTLHLCP